MSDVTRFAPSPTGALHLGHAYAALYAARAGGGRLMLRIEDIDAGRCRPEFEQGIFDDLAWLGLDWQTPVRRQSERLADYAVALETLRARGLLYPCFCSRKDIAAAAGAPHNLLAGPDGPLYPGTCRSLPAAERDARIARGAPYAWRLDMRNALATLSRPAFPGEGDGGLRWRDRGRGWQRATPEIFGDVVLGRKDLGASYHLCVTLDDARQGVTLVTRGEDLFPASHLHRLLQALLDLPVPEWEHHAMLLDDRGQRFAKRNHSVTLRHLRDIDGRLPADIRRLTGIDA